MNIFDVFKNEGPAALDLDDFDSLLKRLLEKVEYNKGSGDLDYIYDSIGEEFSLIGLATIFSIYEPAKRSIHIKHYYIPGMARKHIDNLADLSYLARVIPLERLTNYNLVIEKKEPVFLNNRQNDLSRIFPSLKDANVKIFPFNSIISPLIIKDNVVGTVEILSPSLKQCHEKAFFSFTNSLMGKLSNLVLYHAIKISEEKYRNLFENAKEGFLIFNSKMNKLLEANKGISVITGYTPEELRQMNYINIFHPEDRREVVKFFKERAASLPNIPRFSKIYEARLLTKRGETKNIGLLINRTMSDGEWFVVINDLTDIKAAENNLRFSEEKYRTLIDNAKVGVALVNEDGILTFGNDHFHHIFGYSAGELINKKYKTIVHPDEKMFHEPKFIQKMMQLLKNRRAPYTGKFKGISKDSQIKYIDFLMSQIKNEVGTTSCQLILIDNSENHLLNKKISGAKNHYEKVIDSISDSICVINPSHIILSYNKTFAKKVGFKITELKGKNYFDIISRYENKLFKNFCQQPEGRDCIISRSLLTGRTEVDTITSYDSHNNKRFHKISVFPSKERTGDVYQVVILIRDVTEQMLAAEEVNQIKNFNQRILDTIPVSIISIDRGGFITSVNKYFYNVTAIRDIIGKNIFTLPFYKKNRLVDDYKRLLEQGIPFKKDNLLEINLAGEEKYMNILAVPIKDHGGGIEGAISMAIDNTEANLAHRELEALNNELEQKIIQRTQMLDEVNKKLSRALELKTKFIADTSHELRTPLTIIQGNLDLTAKELSNNKKNMPDLLAIANKEVEHMSAILADLTMLSNSDSETENINLEKVDISIIISAVCQSLKVVAGKKPVKIICKKNYTPVWIMGDEDKLEKLFSNLIRNAIKYNQPGGWIKVWFNKTKSGVNVFVADNGIGIPESDLPFIFERFYRVDKSRSRQEGGSGLGLSICKYIVEKHQGQIGVESTLGKGSIFTVFLPYGFENKSTKSSLF